MDFSKLDELIDLNLRLIRENELLPNQSWFSIYQIRDIANPNATRYIDGYNQKRLADIMRDKGLIDLTDERCDITEFGYEVCENNGWINYLNNLKSIDSESNFDNQDKRIKDLTEENLKLSNINLKLRNKIDSMESKHGWVKIVSDYKTLVGFILLIGSVVGGFLVKLLPYIREILLSK